jgi:gliding motility-associated-like protein
LKKLAVLVALIFCSFSICKAQAWLWSKEAQNVNGYSFGEPGYDHSIVSDGMGNAYMTGFYYDTISFGSIRLITNGDNVFLVKYNNAGSVIWARQASPASYFGYPAGSSVTIGQLSGSIYITGTFNDTVSFSSFKLITNTTLDYDEFLVKYDTGGNVIWAKQANVLSKMSAIQAKSVVNDSKEKIYVAGNFHDSASLGTYKLRSTSSGFDVFIAKYDSTGNVLWAKQGTVNGSSTVGEESETVDRKGNVYVAGYFNGTLTLGSFNLNSISYGGNAFLVKYDSNGNVIWAKQSGLASSACFASINSVSVDASGNPYVTGNTVDTVTFGLFTLINTGTFLVKYDTNGNVIWAKGSEDPYNNYWEGYSVACDTQKQGGVYIVLSGNGVKNVFSLEMGGDTFNLNTINTTATALMHFDSSGNVLCGSIFTEGIEDDGDAVAVDKAGKYIYIDGDIDGIGIIGPDTLAEKSYDAPFISRWQDCGTVFRAYTTSSNVNCNGQCNGQATAVPYGNTAPYTYKWNNGNTSKTTTNLCPGNYWVIVSDSLGNRDSLTVIITQPVVLTTSTSEKNITCNGKANGTASVSPLGGTSPYTYTWINGKTTSSITALTAGNYKVTVKDANGCIASDSINITEPSPITFSTSSVPTKCFGGSDGQGSVIASGGIKPYIYLWNNSKTTQTATGLTAGTYILTVTDSNGCKSKDTVIVSQPSTINLGVSSMPTICPYDSGFAKVTATGGTGAFTYSWTPTGASNSSINGLSAGNYTVTVTDSNGCISTATTSVSITGIPVDTACCNSTITNGQSITLNVVPAEIGNTYNWSPSSGLSCVICPSPIASPTVSTKYYVVVTDSRGCSAIDSVFIEVSQNCEVFVPNAFSPNGDGNNDLFLVKGQCIKSIDMIIFDRWGNKIFETENVSDGWDGTYNNQPMNTGTYAYKLIATRYDGSIVEKNGNVSLVR